MPRKRAANIRKTSVFADSKTIQGLLNHTALDTIVVSPADVNSFGPFIYWCILRLEVADFGPDT